MDVPYSSTLSGGTCDDSCDDSGGVSARRARTSRGRSRGRSRGQGRGRSRSRSRSRSRGRSRSPGRSDRRHARRSHSPRRRRSHSPRYGRRRVHHHWHDSYYNPHPITWGTPLYHSYVSPPVVRPSPLPSWWLRHDACERAALQQCRQDAALDPLADEAACRLGAMVESTQDPYALAALQPTPSMGSDAAWRSYLRGRAHVNTCALPQDWW